MPRPTVYVASALANADLVLDLERELADHGIAPSYSWATDYQEEKAGRARFTKAQQARLCLAGVRTADVVVFVPPGKRGAHVEFGAALGLNKPVVLWARPDVDDAIGFHELAWASPASRGGVVRYVRQAVGLPPAPPKEPS